MTLYLIKRVVSAVVLTFVVTMLTFVLMYGDGPGIARAVVGSQASQAQVHAKLLELGLDRPVLERYWDWLTALLSGKGLGRSYFTGEPVTTIMSARIPVTLSIVFVALLLTTVLSVVIGVVAAVRGGWVDRILQFLVVLGYAVPSFIAALLLIFAFAIKVPLLPATGFVPATVSVTGWLESITLPVTAMVIGAVSATAQQFRGTVSDVLRRDFVRTLRARGIPARAVIGRHVLRNAAGPGLISLGLQTIGLFGAAVIIEQVFALGGIGNLTVSSSLSGDIPVVMGCVLFIVGLVVVVNTLTDIAHAWLNPKVRVS